MIFDAGVAYFSKPENLLIGGATRDGLRVWNGTPPGSFVRLTWVSTDGHPRLISAYPALVATDTLIDISTDGSFLIDNRKHSGADRHVTVVRNGVRMTLQQLVKTIVGGSINLDLLRPVSINSAGSVLLLADNLDVPAASGAWLLTADGTLSLLWNSAGANMNDSGTVVGTRINADGSSTGVRFDGSTVTAVAGLFGAQAISPDGTLIAG